MSVIVICVVLAALGIVLQGRKQGADDRRIAVTERRVDSLRVSYRQARQRASHEQAVSQKMEHRGAAMGIRVTEQAFRAAAVSDSLKTLPDTADFRDALQTATVQIDSLVNVVTSYVVLVDSIRDQHARERRSMAVAMADADSTIAVQSALIASLRADRCRVLGLPCPSRSQAFIAGALLVTLAVLR